MEAELEMIEGEAVREEKRWRVPEREDEAKISGGERMRKKLARAFGKNRHVLLLDEPTANLDREGIAQLTEQLGRVETFLCISHDRKLLNEACTRILEVSGGENQAVSGKLPGIRTAKGRRAAAGDAGI